MTLDLDCFIATAYKQTRCSEQMHDVVILILDNSNYFASFF